MNLNQQYRQCDKQLALKIVFSDIMSDADSFRDKYSSDIFKTDYWVFYANNVSRLRCDETITKSDDLIETIKNKHFPHLNEWD